MAASANVRSVEALKRFRGALLRFCETASRSLGEADSEITRAVDWVEQTQGSHWRREIKTRTEDIASARTAVFRRENRSLSETPGATEERKNLTTARVRLRDAEERTRTVKTWSRRLREEADRYHARVERLSSAVHTELPEAAVRLTRMIESLEAYLAIAGPVGNEGAARREGGPEGATGEPGSAPSMARSTGQAPAGSHRPWWSRLRERAGVLGSPPGLPGAASKPAAIDGADLAGRMEGVRLEPLRSGDTVVVEEGALAGREFFLLRRRAGEGWEWVAGRTDEDAPVGGAVRLPAASLAGRLGAAAGVLLLPGGWLAVVRAEPDGQGVRLRLVADAEDRERLSEAAD